MSLKIALLGYGQMGQMLEKLAPQEDCEVVAIFDPNIEEFTNLPEAASLADVDVCLDFSLPGEVLKNVERVAAAGKNIVIGTTGWYDDLHKIEEIVTGNDTGLLYGGNFSVGMNLFFLLTEAATRLISETDLYDVFGYEMHHNRKADSPSGTARELAEIIIANHPLKKSVEYERVNRKIGREELHFASIRGGSIPGTHIIGFDSPFDTIELKHTARTREGFAVGALKAAHWLRGKRGVHNFQKIFPELINKDKKI